MDISLVFSKLINDSVSLLIPEILGVGFISIHTYYIVFSPDKMGGSCEWVILTRLT